MSIFKISIMWNSCDPNLEDDTNDANEDVVNDDSVGISTKLCDNEERDMYNLVTLLITQ